MRIDVKVTDGELDEMGLTENELMHAIAKDLDTSRDYAGFNVHVSICDFSDESVFE
ncbi:hypothetical protein J3D56_004232 [Erwinia persicina]|nr:hypothetical protein [Erwinia persicina]